MKNVAAYIRVSTDGQLGDEKYGLEAQRAEIVKYCEKNDMNIIKWFSDEGESGAKVRPGFDEIIYGDVFNPPIEAVVVAKSDRVARDINVYFYYQGYLKIRKEIDLISVTEDFGQFGVFAEALKVFTMTCAKIERDNINRRTSAGRLLKAQKGGYSGGRPPFGYRVDSGRLVVVPEEAETVKKVFQMKGKEGKTYKEIVDYLNSQGLKNRSGTAFSISTVQVIYENKKTYEGFYRYGKDGEWVKGVHEPILKEEVE